MNFQIFFLCFLKVIFLFNQEMEKTLEEEEQNRDLVSGATQRKLRGGGGLLVVEYGSAWTL